MRNALARAELAAGELSRHAATPRIRQLALSVSQAVADADHLVAVLARRPAGAHEEAQRVPLGSILELLRSRLAPSLEARGILWMPLADQSEEAAADPVLAHRAGVALLRATAALLEDGGTLTLDARAEPGGWRLELGLKRCGSSESTDLIVSASESLASVARRFAAGFACFQAGSGPAITAVLSFRAEKRSCNAS